ncbi:hypothetical protein ES708_34384 [subsurface metagenome]
MRVILKGSGVYLVSEQKKRLLDKKEKGQGSKAKLTKLTLFLQKGKGLSKSKESKEKSTKREMSPERPQGVPSLAKKNIRKGRYFMLRNVEIFRMQFRSDITYKIIVFIRRF